MTARDISPEQVEAVDRFISGPAQGNPRKALARQICAVARMLAWCDLLISEAAEARIAAPGILEIREWCEFSLLEIACRVARDHEAEPRGTAS